MCVYIYQGQRECVCMSHQAPYPLRVYSRLAPYPPGYLCRAHVQSFVCFMCSLQSVLCAAFSLCCVQLAVTNIVASR